MNRVGLVTGSRPVGSSSPRSRLLFESNDRLTLTYRLSFSQAVADRLPWLSTPDVLALRALLTVDVARNGDFLLRYLRHTGQNRFPAFVRSLVHDAEALGCVDFAAVDSQFDGC